MKSNQKTVFVKNTMTPTVPRFSTMLALQQDTAWWLKVHNGIIVDYQSFEFEGASDTEAVETLVPRWRHDESQDDVLFVDLVLDTTIDEVDRIGVSSSGSRIIDHYRQKRTLKRLRKDFPHAYVYPLSSHTDERAALMHPVVPDAWSDWLLRIQACRIVIQRVVTSTQLGCHWSSRFSGYVLLNMPSASRSRHVMSKDGAARFLRTMRALPQECVDLRTDEATSKADLSELNQTIEYIRAHTSLATQALLIVEPVCAPASSLAANYDYENVRAHSDSTEQDLTQTLSPSVYCLFAMFYDQPVHYRSRLEVSTPQISTHNDKSDANAIGIELKRPVFRGGVVSMFMPRSVVKCVSRWVTVWSNKNQWLLIVETLRWAHYLQPSMKHLTNLHRQRYLSKLCIGLVCSLVVAGSAISIKGVAGYRTVERNVIERVNKEGAIEKPLHVIKELHVPLSFAADSLFIMDELSRVSQPNADVLLTSIARVLTEAPDITIDRLAWISLEDNELFETLTHGSLAVTPRTSIVDTLGSSNVQMQIEGTVSVAALADQKSKLDKFVNELKILSTVSLVRILESPLDSALSSGGQVHEAGQYRLSILLSGVQ